MDKLEYRAVIKFLTKERTAPSDIHKRLQAVYGKDAPSRSTVKAWARQFRLGKQSIGDEPRSGRPVEATGDDMVLKINELITENNQLTKKQLANMLNISSERVLWILHDKLGMNKVAGRWIRSTSSTSKNQQQDHNDEGD
ncbi:protein GVQW3-like [Lutzomyia longipalpis]|uniref:protein GVQW3-like n=1 Tax=Lutzomyia longipalpis TaxID=7200 RepID=UPI00248448F3|nr:protein GVQW3-like [Lutzomyia longipalpis]